MDGVGASVDGWMDGWTREAGWLAGCLGGWVGECWLGSDCGHGEGARWLGWVGWLGELSTAEPLAGEEGVYGLGWRLLG